MADGGIAAGLCVTVFSVSFWEASTGKERAICNLMMQAAFLVWAGVQLQTMPVEKKETLGENLVGDSPILHDIRWSIDQKLPFNPQVGGKTQLPIAPHKTHDLNNTHSVNTR